MKLEDFLIKNKIKYKNIYYYEKALIHKSFSFENKLEINYQRLEFLGDSIIDFLVAEFLFLKFPKLNEGEMSIIKANIVKGQNLANATRKIGLENYIKTGNKKDAYLENNSKIYSDVFESFLGAIYLDLGMLEAKKFIFKTLLKDLKKLNVQDYKNPKTLLQEFLQIDSRKNVFYSTTKTSDGTFFTEVFHENKKFGEGEGKTKKESEVLAAKKALKILVKNS